MEASEARALVPLCLGLVGALETPEGSERDERNYLAWIFSPMLSVRRAVTLHQAHHGAAFGIGSGRGKETDRYVPTRLCLSKPRTGKLMALLCVVAGS